MKIKRLSSFSFKVNEMEIPLTPAQFAEGELKRAEGAPVQKVYPMLSAEHREFLISGITPEEWEEAFGPEED